MRFRDIASILLFAAGTVLLGHYGCAMLQNMLLNSTEVNRDDARRVTSTLLTHDHWVEFPVLRDATNLRLLTNAALISTDAPDHDLTNPRVGWRYAIDYELLDSDGQLVADSRYHFRSHIRQLLQVEDGKKIYPIFVGKSGLVATQTRIMQVSLDQFERRPTTIRMKLSAKDPSIQEVTARLLSRIERADYDKRFTWNRLSEERRESICRYCVYEPELLTHNERNNLLHWRWARTPALCGDQNRHMYFIGDVDDQEVREEQLPIGAATDSHWPATIPVPEGAGHVRLEFQPAEFLPANDSAVVVRWYGLGLRQRRTLTHQLSPARSVLHVDTDGGLLQIEPSQRAVVRAYWSAAGNSAAGDHEEIEITPDPILIRTFIVDQKPLEYEISHHADQPTYLRVALRYPYGVHFGNQVLESHDHATDGAPSSAQWEFIDARGEIVKSGTTRFQPIPSKYECLHLYGQNEFLSESHDLYFQVPAGVQRIRLRSSSNILLAAASVRPAELPRTTQIPEDYQPYHARESLNRSWYGLNPPQHHALVQSNRSFIVRARNRPPQDNEDILAGNYQWRRFLPRGRWIGRQMLVPLDDEIELAEHAIDFIYHGLSSAKTYDFSSATSTANVTAPTKLIWIGDDAPGNITVRINQQIVLHDKVDSARGELNMTDIIVPDRGRISIESDNPAQFFFAGRSVDNVTRYFKRTAQRLNQGQLEFDYEKRSADDELLTIQLYRSSREEQRARLHVTVDSSTDPFAANVTPTILAPTDSWTARNRIYDLRPLPGPGSLLLGSQDPVDLGHRFFVRLGKDLEPGTYKIKIRRIDNVNDGYVLMYQTVAGTQPVREVRIHSHSQAQHEQ